MPEVFQPNPGIVRPDAVPLGHSDSGRPADEAVDENRDQDDGRQNHQEGDPTLAPRVCHKSPLTWAGRRRDDDALSAAPTGSMRRVRTLDHWHTPASTQAWAIAV